MDPVTAIAIGVPILAKLIFDIFTRVKDDKLSKKNRWVAIFWDAFDAVEAVGNSGLIPKGSKFDVAWRVINQLAVARGMGRPSEEVMKWAREEADVYAQKQKGSIPNPATVPANPARK